MDLELTPDQRELHAVAAQALDEHAPLSLARRFLDGAAAEPLHGLLRELGWYGVCLDGQEAFGIVGLILLADQAGRHVAPTTLVDTAVAARIATGLGGELGTRLADGELTTALAVVEAAADWGLSGSTTTLARSGADWQLDGQKIGVQHAATADALLVVTEIEDGPAAALVATDTPGMTIEPTRGLDPAAAIATVDLERVSVDPDALVTGERAASLIEAAFAVGAVATAAEGIGAASAALDLALAYSLEREQFGRPIAGFQALRHLMADAHVDREAAWSSVLYAAAALDEALPDATDTASIAAANAARASRRVVEAALQVFGGIAFTWEHDVHLLQRRVLSAERRFGDALWHESRLGARLATSNPLPVAS